MTELAQDLVNAAALGGLYALAALGIALIFGVMRLINFAHGELIMLGAFFTLLVSGAPAPLLVGATVAAVLALAVTMERVAFRPVRGADPSTLLVTSFAVSALLQNLLILAVGSRPKSVSVFPDLTRSVDVLGVTVQRIDIVTVVVSVLLLGGVALLLGRTRIGVEIRAASENFRMARLLGVRSNFVIATAFAISGGLAAVLALMIVARTGNLFPTLGLQPALIGFIATVIGGMGSLPGAVVGGYLLGAITVALEVALPVGISPYRDAFLFAAVIVILLVRPQGLLPSRLSTERV